MALPRWLFVAEHVSERASDVSRKRKKGGRTYLTKKGEKKNNLVQFETERFKRCSYLLQGLKIHALASSDIRS